MANSHSPTSPASPLSQTVIEDERRYWVQAWDASVIEGVTPVHIFQGYFKPNERIRIYDKARAEHTIKKGKGGVNRETTTPMPLAEATRLLEMRATCGVEKLRYVIPVDPAMPEGLVWEIDLYQGDGLGAVKLEVERKEGWEGAFPPPLPSWIREAHDATDELSDYLVACALRDFSPGGGNVPARLLAAVRDQRRRQQR